MILKTLVNILNQSKEKQIGRILTDKNLSVSCAESCTGGLLSSLLTDISGSSAYINQNFVTYANEAKVNLLGVNTETIAKYGVVSEEVALEMASGLIERYNCNVAVSTTGIAGPSGATENKPVGLVCIGVANKNKKISISYKAPPKLPRRLMKYEFAHKALELLLKFLKENY